MIVKLKTQQLSNLDQVRSFMAGTAAVAFVVPAHQDRYPNFHSSIGAIS